MALTLYMHPLSSYCQKVLIALYENDTPFMPQVVDFSDAAQNAAFKEIWPVRQFPVLRDGNQTIPESTGIIAYLARHHPGPVRLVPDDPDAAIAVRAQDRFYDLHIHSHMQKVVVDRTRPAGTNDAYGVERAREALNTALGLADAEMARNTWAAGDAFSMADCAAAPALFYIDMAIAPLSGRYRNLAAYLERLTKRPSYARVLNEAKPYFEMVPR